MNTFAKQRLTGLHLVVSVLALAVCLAAQQSVRADNLEAVQTKVLKATGFMVVPKADNKVGYGTCWIVDHQRKLVVTNTHVVGNAETCKVAFPQFSRGQVLTNSELYNPKDFIPGKVLARDPKRDLALIQLDRLPADAQALDLAPTSIAAGGRIFAVGNSGMAGKHLNQGSLFRQREGVVKNGFFWKTHLKGIEQKLEMRVIQTDSGSKPGDSGGPVVDEQGRLVGVNSASNEAGDYAVDVSEVRVFLARWIASPNLPPPETGLAGTWTVTWKHKDKDHFAGLVLKSDGSGHWDGSKIAPGTYSHADGRLAIKMPGGMENSGLVVWESNNMFRWTVQFSDATIEFTVTRR